MLTYSNPLVISKGGTYSGNWRSLTLGTPAIHITTSDPVTIENSNVSSVGVCIQADANSNVTVLNTSGYGLLPNKAGTHQDRFFYGIGLKSLDIENCDINGTIGIYVLSSNGTINIKYNTAINLDGRYSDGNNGYQQNTSFYGQFIQLDKCKPSQCEISYNIVHNFPGYSRTEDVISIYESAGQSSSPIAIHHNLINGSYPYPPTGSFSGGGIMTADGLNTGWVNAYNNVVIDTINYGIAAAGGHDINIYNNTILSTGKFVDGSLISAQNVGLYLWNNSNDPNWGNNVANDNIIGWVEGSGRNDTWIGGTATGAKITNTVVVPNPVTQNVCDKASNILLAQIIATSQVM